jgi:hypothetical protein
MRNRAEEFFAPARLAQPCNPPTDCCHFNSSADGINRHRRDNTAVGKEYMVERAISVHQDLRALATNVFELRQKLPEIGGW